MSKDVTFTTGDEKLDQKIKDENSIRTWLESCFDMRLAEEFKATHILGRIWNIFCKVPDGTSLFILQKMSRLLETTDIAVDSSVEELDSCCGCCGGASTSYTTLLIKGATISEGVLGNTFDR